MQNDKNTKPECDCGNRPTWIYMPGYVTGNDFSCDSCVPRGCTCNSEPLDGNWENQDPSNWIMPTDDQGREYPCCEHEPIHESEWDKEGNLTWMLED